jgi:hypothetical protein
LEEGETPGPSRRFGTAADEEDPMVSIILNQTRGIRDKKGET